jgi:tyrosine-specific transport protein
MSSRLPRVIGGSLLIAGSCIGAGMLGLPVLTGYMGFIPATLGFFLIWAFMSFTGLLLAEVNMLYGRPVGLVSLAGATLGRTGKVITWLLFLFIFYSLTVAYILGSGEFLSDIAVATLGISIKPITGSIVFTLLFGLLVYRGTRAVDLFNRLLMVGLVLSYGILVSVAFPLISESSLKRAEWGFVISALPGLIVAFGFHNVIPTLYRYLDSDKNMMRYCVWIGCAIPLIIYLLFEYVVLGVLSVEGEYGLRQAFQQGMTATHMIGMSYKLSYLNLGALCFAFFALTTSFLAQSLSFVDFLSDGLQIKKQGLRKLYLCTIVFLPPFALGVVDPTIFYLCLEYAGAFGATILFGILPILMVKRLRNKHPTEKHFVVGGDFSLVILFCFACALILFGIARQIGWLDLYGVL